MHTLTLCALLVPPGLVVPPTTTFKGKPLAAATVFEAASEIGKLPGEKVGLSATPTNNWPAWSDDGKFPLEVNLSWARIEFFCKPKGDWVQMHIIDCDSTDKAKKYFAQLRALRHLDYAQSGKYLIKGSPQALDWFTKHYGAARCATSPETPAKDKK